MKYYLLILSLFTATVSFAQGPDNIGTIPVSNFNKTINGQTLQLILANFQGRVQNDSINATNVIVSPFTFSGMVNRDSLFRRVAAVSDFKDGESKSISMDYWTTNPPRIKETGFATAPYVLSGDLNKMVGEKQSPVVDPGNFSYLGMPKLTKPDVSTYVNLPTGAKGFFEIHNDEIKAMNGTTTTLSTTTVSAMIWNNRSTTPLNGAEIADYHIADEKIFGSGKVAWFVATAPTSSKEVSVNLTTFANFQKNSDAGAFTITTNNGILELATIDKNEGKVGWAVPNAGTKLDLSAAQVYTPGNFSVDGAILAKNGLFIGNMGTDYLSISSDKLTFNDNGTSSYIASFREGLNGNSAFPGIAINTESIAGISFNASGDFPAIRFSLNRNVIGQFFDESMIIGPGYPDPSVVLMISSKNRGVLIPRLTVDEIFKMENPTEGVLVYCYDWHCFVFHNGTEWTLMDGTTKLVRRPNNAVANATGTKEL
ncbi:MAG: hypothetical protein ACXVA0_22565 [Mucilaginibacter sp.]